MIGQPVPLPPEAVKAAARVLAHFEEPQTEPWPEPDAEQVGCATAMLAAAADVLYASERERIRKAILARAIQCRTCGKPHLGYLQPGVDGHPYEARFASPSSSLLERLVDLLEATP